jgi:hypothetical protein
VRGLNWDGELGNGRPCVATTSRQAPSPASSARPTEIPSTGSASTCSTIRTSCSRRTSPVSPATASSQTRDRAPSAPASTRTGPGDRPYRLGCYLNEFGNANYRFTVPDSLVYVGILGTGRDLGTLHDWAWLGNREVPGSPTVWREPAR